MRQAGEDVLEVFLGVDPLHLAVEQHCHDDGALSSRILGSAAKGAVVFALVTIRNDGTAF
jgi:hypothetical protein